AAVSAMTSSQLEPAALDVRSGPYRLLLKFESTPAAVGTYLQRARALMSAADTQVVTSQSESDLWREHIRAPWRFGGMVLRFAWLPASLGAVLTFVEELQSSVSDVELIGRVALGSGLLRIDADVRVQRNIVERMRSRNDIFRHVVVLRAEPSLKQHVDVWGPLGDAGTLGASVKH